MTVALGRGNAIPSGRWSVQGAPRERPRHHAAVEDSGSDSEDTEADEAEWEDILAAMGGVRK